MTEIYLVRHCETVSNIRGTLAGWLDSDISELGARQLEQLGERFKDVKFDKVYTTHLKRAKLTAAAMNRYSGAPLETDDRFLEVRLGSYEDLPIPQLPDVELYNWDNAPHLFGAPDGERMTDVLIRGEQGIKEVVRKNPDSVIGIASHGGCIKAVMTVLYGYMPEEMVKVPWTLNTAVTHLYFEDENHWDIDYYNDVSHLDGDLMSGRVEDWGK